VNARGSGEFISIAAEAAAIDLSYTYFEVPRHARKAFSMDGRPNHTVDLKYTCIDFDSVF
jgi:hypothetical protein